MPHRHIAGAAGGRRKPQAGGLGGRRRRCARTVGHALERVGGDGLNHVLVRQLAALVLGVAVRQALAAAGGRQAPVGGGPWHGTALGEARAPARLWPEAPICYHAALLTTVR